MAHPFLRTKRVFTFVIILSCSIIPDSLSAQEFNGTFSGEMLGWIWCNGLKDGEQGANAGNPGGRYSVALMPQNTVLSIEHDWFTYTANGNMNFDGSNTTTANLSGTLKIDKTFTAPYYTDTGEKIHKDVIRDTVPVSTRISIDSQGGCNITLGEFTLNAGRVSGCNDLNINIESPSILTCTDMSNTTPK